MGIVIAFPSRDAASRRPDAAEPAEQVLGQVPGQVVILPVIRIERYEDQPAGYVEPRRGDPTRRRRRRALRS